MTDGSKKKFMTAIFGQDGTQIDSATAAALLAATCSGGNPEIGNKGGGGGGGKIIAWSYDVS